MISLGSGNIRRSPQLDDLLRAQIPAAFDRTAVEVLAVASASTQGGQGASTDRYDDGVARGPGTSGIRIHRVTRLRKRDLWRAELVLGSDRPHRDLAGKVLRYRSNVAFTIVEFALIVEHLASSEGERVQPLGPDGFAPFMRRVVKAAEGARAEVRLKEAIALDLADPDHSPPEVYRASVDAFDEHIGRIAAGLRALAAG